MKRSSKKDQRKSPSLTSGGGNTSGDPTPDEVTSFNRNILGVLTIMEQAVREQQPSSQSISSSSSSTLPLPSSSEKP